jgi:hypothetical protein
LKADCMLLQLIRYGYERECPQESIFDTNRLNYLGVMTQYYIVICEN